MNDKAAFNGLDFNGLPDTPLAWALAYAKTGLAIFPTNAQRKPLTEHGFKDASTDQAKITAWWAKWPYAEIALAVPDGVAILDLDCKKGKNGRAVYRRLEGVDPETIEAPMASSPTGGLHIWTNANGRKLKQKSGYEAQGIDMRLHRPWLCHAAGGEQWTQMAQASVDTHAADAIVGEGRGRTITITIVIKGIVNTDGRDYALWQRRA